MTDCFDETNSIQRNNLLLGSTAISPVSDRGTFTLGAIDIFTTDFEKNVVFTEGSDNPITILIDAYGDIDFYNSVRELNTFIFNTSPNFEGFESLKTRKETNVIFTPFEVAQFTLDYAYTPLSLTNIISSNRNKVLFELDSFYTDSFTQTNIGAFCALAPTVFGAIDGFFDALDNLGSFIKRIQNFSLSKLLSNLKEQILKVFDKIIAKVKGIIEKFSIANVVGKVEAFINENIILRAKQLKDDALSFFSEENIEKIKKRISASIDYMTGIFKNPTIDEIQYIIYRFCGLASQV
jgi:hypothetical protein